jgi:hypothetical protein
MVVSYVIIRALKKNEEIEEAIAKDRATLNA